jgi:two-component system CheB/CheR fusion protein
MTKEYLQATIEELESGSEELKASNEELQSANEELQSTNEELETSKEELQSSNEELTTVNDELQNRMLELQQANDDLHNVLSGIGDAIIIVGMDLRIRRFTYAAERLLNLVSADVGRSANQLNIFIAGESMEKIVADVIERLLPLEREVRCADDRWYMLRVNPYRTLDHAIKGAVIVLEDIDVKKRSTERYRDVATFADLTLAAIGHPLLIVDKTLTVRWASKQFVDAFGAAAADVVDKHVSVVLGGAFARRELITMLTSVSSDAAAAPAAQRHAMRAVIRGTERDVTVGAGRIQPPGVDQPLILISFDVP